MILRNLTAERNPYLLATLVTISYILGISIVNYLRHKQFDIREVLIGAVVFWVIFFLVQRWLLRKLKGKKRR